MLGGHLATLDVPSDGSAKLMSVQTTIGPDGCKQWTVIFREIKASIEPAAPCGDDTPSKPSPLPLPLAAKIGTPSTPKSVGFAPQSFTKPPPSAAVVPSLVPSHLVPATSPHKPDMIVAAPHKMMMDRIFPLKCQVKTYAWGKLGEASLVGCLAAEGLEELELTDAVPYAELWMGTHPSGPSMVMLSSPWRTVTPLSEWIKLNPSLLGPARPDRALARIERRKSMLRLTASSLPFLFKILSVRTALSIQAHPDKALAAQLHARQPDMYKDDNHKPEMAVAITPFEALCSFQSGYSILENCRATPELVALIGDDTVADLDDAVSARSEAEHYAERPLSPKAGNRTPVLFAQGSEGLTTPSGVDVHQAFRAALREVFTRLITAPAQRVQEQLQALVKRIASTNKMLRAPVDDLAMRLHEQYPADVGVFCAYLLNYKQLQPGEALFLAANEPHAYISGDCAEVMATSDNVVRAGLTPKWKDVDTLCEMLTYKDGAPYIVTPTQTVDEPHVYTYTPPAEIEEFMLDRVELPEEGAAAKLPASTGLAVLIVVNGTVAIEQLDDATEDAVGMCHQLNVGAVHLVCPHTVLRIAAVHGPAQLFRAAAKPFIDDISLDTHTGLTTS